MTASSIAIASLLCAAVIVELLACAGLVAMPTTLTRLHFVGPAACVGPWFVGIAILIGTHATADQAAKGLLIALVLSAFAGALSHETACAALAREPERK